MSTTDHPRLGLRHPTVVPATLDGSDTSGDDAEGNDADGDDANGD